MAPLRDRGARPTVLVTGGTGQIGHELVRALADVADVVSPGRAVLDLSEPFSIRSAIRAIAPDIILNAAAYTDVDRAESEPELCEMVNAVAPGIIAEEVVRLGGVMIQYSTDYVFDGTSDAPYTEDDLPGPLNVYGATKLRGEEAVRAARVPALILRTSWVYGHHGDNFMRSILRLAREREELRIVADQFGAPTWSRSIAAATAAVVRRLLDDPRDLTDSGREIAGVYHMAAAGRTSWHGFAEAILARDPRSSEHRARRIVAIATSDYPATARRPVNSVLASDMAADRLGVRIPDWQEDLAAAMSPDGGI